MTEDFSARFLRVARQLGVEPKEPSISYLVKKLRGAGEEPNEAQLIALVRESAKTDATHYMLPKAGPTLNPRDEAVRNLEAINAYTHATRPDAKNTGRMKLSKDTKERARRWGPGALLDIANTEAPAFENESNADEP